ncbi:MAG: hypothetical protein R2879_04645 [Saprospiraceae bacterium]
MSFTILKVYLIWTVIYLCSIGFGLALNEGDLESLFAGPYAPYGGLTITYFLLGNFVYLLWFVPLWNWRIKYWVIKTDE